MSDVLVYSSVVGELPKIVRENIPMCFVEWKDYVQLEEKLKLTQMTLNSVNVNADNLYLIYEDDKKDILKQYLAWVDQVSEDLEDKSWFTPEEILNKLIEIMGNKK